MKKDVIITLQNNFWPLYMIDIKLLHMYINAFFISNQNIIISIDFIVLQSWFFR